MSAEHRNNALRLLFFKINIFKRKFCIRFAVLLASFVLSFYFSVFLFRDLKSPLILHLTNLDRCPACYGVSLCPELYSNLILLDTSYRWSNIFNVKNVFYGYTKTKKKVVLKKLGHTSELEKFDDNLCKNWNLSSDCKPKDLLALNNIEENIKDLIKFDIEMTDPGVRNGMVLCPYDYSALDLMRHIVQSDKMYKSDLINAWTMLKINIEPIVIQMIPKSLGWPVPEYGGVCGRLEVVAFEGQPLSSKMDAPWHERLHLAQKILKAAVDFTFKHDRYRFYLMDWSLDNIVVNEKNDVTFVDLEDVIILDKHTSPRKNLPDWYKNHSESWSGPEYAFSIGNICKHHLSDHNLWAACYILFANDSPLLYPIPEYVNAAYPNLSLLLEKCLYQDNRFPTVTDIIQLITQILSDKKILNSGNVR